MYEKLTGFGEFIADLKNWRKSRLLLTILINGTAFIIFCLWVHEAHKSAKAQSLLKNRDPSNADDTEPDANAGKLVSGTVQDERFLTPGQEWLLDNFTVTPINFREGRYWTVFTAIFSHQLPAHTFLNMLCSHLLLTGLTPLFGTLPVATTFLAGGIGANLVVTMWMAKRGKDNFIEKYPGQFFGGLGMSAANLSLLGFAASVHPKWVIRVWGVVPVKISWVIIGAWVFEAIQYWNQEGWEKIQSSVWNPREFEFDADGSLMDI
jgi:membrane associated rhomboid family serine protease